MKKFLVGAALAGTLLLGIETGASAHNTAVETDVVCTSGAAFTRATFTNDYTVPLTVMVFDGDLVVPPATEKGPRKATISGGYQAGVHSYTAVWDDGYTVEGTFEVPILIDGCAPPIHRCDPAPTCTPVSDGVVSLPPVTTTTTTTPPTTVPPDAITETSVPSVMIIEQVESQEECNDEGNERECLPRTGSTTEPLLWTGAVLIAGGLWIMGVGRKRQTT